MLVPFSSFEVIINYIPLSNSLIFPGVFLQVTVVTVAFGNSKAVGNWAIKWSSLGVDCVIANNGSSTSTYYGDRVKVLPSIGNIGFGAAINRAVSEVKTSIVLITNPDTLPFSSGSLEKLLNCHKEGVITGAVTVSSKGAIVHSTGIWPDSSWVKSQIVKSASSLWRKDRYDWLQGGLLMVHKKDFLKVGGFDESYPLYFEDIDFCANAKKVGISINLCKKTKFIHEEGTGAERATVTRLSCFHWGLYQFFKKHVPVEVDSVKRMLICKCVVRIFQNSIFHPEQTRGYIASLKSIIKNEAPSLPKASDE